MKRSHPASQTMPGQRLVGSIALAGSLVLALLVGTTPGRAAGYTVEAQNYAFVAPGGGNTVEIRVGDKVTWVASGDPHTVSSGTPGAIDNRFPDHPASVGFLVTGQTFTTTFTSAGTYPYFCEVHPEQMTGTVKVLVASTPAPTARPTPRPTRAPTAAPSTRPPVTAAPTPTSAPTSTPSSVPTPNPSPTILSSAGTSPSASPVPSPPAGGVASGSARGDGSAAPLLLAGLGAIGAGLLVWLGLRLRRRGAA